MTVKRMDNVAIVVEDLPAAIAFFVELGLELEGETTVEGSVVDRTVGLERRPIRHRHDAHSGRSWPRGADEVPHSSGRQRHAETRR